MKKLSILDLAKILNARADAVRSTQHTAQVSTDSRTVKPGDCFFAIAGPNFDGHNFLADAFAKGASCAVISKSASISNQQSAISNKIILKVDDTVKALGLLAAWYRKDCNFKVVAITGSTGKTTTRQIVYHVLSKRFKTRQPAKNFNNFIGLPLTILAAPADTQILVLELATNSPGEIEYLSQIAAPDIALITNVYPAHLAGFGSIEKIAEEKISIVKCLSDKGILILNADCPPLVDSARHLNLSFKTFSYKELTDNISVNPLSSRITIDDVTVEIPLPGRGNVENTLAAWAICSILGVSTREFADSVKTINPVSMRTELLHIGSLTVINDCYNANPASMKNALEILIRLDADQKRRSVFVCGDMAELGDSEQDLHQQLGRQIAKANINVLITVGNLAALAADAAKQENSALSTHKFASAAELCIGLHNLIKDSDIILVKGSRVNKLETVVEKLKVLRDLK
jgi:UDP-N-acetylmuramoyl-tripeptide--D-alanyl-D-alanine ligase